MFSRGKEDEGLIADSGMVSPTGYRVTDPNYPALIMKIDKVYDLDPTTHYGYGDDVGGICDSGDYERGGGMSNTNANLQRGDYCRCDRLGTCSCRPRALPYCTLSRHCQCSVAPHHECKTYVQQQPAPSTGESQTQPQLREGVNSISSPNRLGTFDTSKLAVNSRNIYDTGFYPPGLRTPEVRGLTIPRQGHVFSLTSTPNPNPRPSGPGSTHTSAASYNRNDCRGVSCS